MRRTLGIDLSDYFRGLRDWDELYYFVQNPEQGSHLWAAQQDDDELAEAMIELTVGTRQPAYRPGLIGWTADRADMATLIDWVAAQATGGEKFKPLPRPQTAEDRVKEARKNVKVSAVSAKLTGKE